MKISITADVHLTTREEHAERYNALENMLGQSRDEGAPHLFIAGDLFDKDYRSYAEFERLCESYPEVQVHVVPGNHDPGISERSLVGDNIQVYSKPAILEIDTATFLFVPYEEKATMGERIADMEDRIRDKPWFLVAHGDYYGGVKELNPFEPGTYMPLSRKNVDKYEPRHVFLGHIHRPVRWGRVHVPGSPCGLDISETGKRRFLLLDTANGSIESRPVTTDTIYFDESFVIVPLDSEASLLRHEIETRIAAWDIGHSDRPKVRVRVSAKGYATDRRAILESLKEGFGEFKYYENEDPKIEELLTSADRQRNAVAERTRQLIDECAWPFGEDEPEREQVLIKALSVIYGD